MAALGMESAGDAADRLREEGLTLIPLGSPFENPPGYFVDRHGDEAAKKWPKTPRVEWQEFQQREPTDAEWDRWRRNYPRANWGILTGRQIVVVDADSAEAINWIEQGGIARTPRTVDTAHGRHYYFASNPQFPIKNSAGKSKIDIRGHGGYVVAPGSVHESGVLYEEHRAPGIDCDHRELPILTAADLAAIQRYNGFTPPELRDGKWDITPSLVGARVDVGQRNTALAASVGAWVRDGDSLDQLRAKAHAWNHELPAPLQAGEVDQTVLSILSTHIKRNPVLPAEAPEPHNPEDGPRYKLLTGADIEAMPDIQWRVKKILPAQGISAIYGASMCGKSFLAFDMGCAIAEGAEWFGNRTFASAVVYVCLEGEAGYKLRKKAWEQRNGRPCPQGLRFVMQPFALRSGADVLELAAAINETLEPGGVVIIDTLNRASPGMDENSSKDMGEVIEASKVLHKRINGLVVLVAHTGKDETKGLRGHSSLIAALDAAVLVKRDGEFRSWETEKVKDGKDDVSEAFRLDVVSLGFDGDGDEITSCVIQRTNVPAAARRPQLSTAERIGLRAFETAVAAAGHTDRLGNVLGVDVAHWRQAFYAASTADTHQAKKKAFTRVRESLVDKGYLAVHEDVYRRIHGTSEASE